MVLQGPPNQFEVLGVGKKSAHSSVSPARYTTSGNAEGRINVGGRKTSSHISHISNAKKTISGFNKSSNVNAGNSGTVNAHSTFHGGKGGKLWTGFYPKFQQ